MPQINETVMIKDTNRAGFQPTHSFCKTIKMLTSTTVHIARFHACLGVVGVEERGNRTAVSLHTGLYISSPLAPIH